jgi:GlpG protein
MRQIGEIDDKGMALVFSDYLTQLGIENKVRENPDALHGQYEIWVLLEDNLEQAEELLGKFLKYPDDPEFQNASREARKIKKKARREEKEGAQYMDARTTVFYKGAPPVGRLTILLIVVCVTLSLLSRLGEQTDSLRMFFITDIIRDGTLIRWRPGLPEIRNWEIWRLFTPMFIHFGPMHLLFNMLWLWDLGSMVEDRKGTLFFAVFILIVSGAGNLAQYLVSHPLFGGMSGVVYGLLGYIWMKGKYDPASQLFLHKTTVMFMILWYFLCLTGLVGNIANAAHTAGLLIGVAWGYLSSPKFRQVIGKMQKK